MLACGRARMNVYAYAFLFVYTSPSFCMRLQLAVLSHPADVGESKRPNQEMLAGIDYIHK